MSDTAYAVESFVLQDDGAPQKQLRLEGWFHARVGVTGMQLAIPGQPLMIEEFRRASPGLIPMFGESGRNCRFFVQGRLEPAAEAKLSEARLLVLLANNDGMTIDVSRMLTLAVVPAAQGFGDEDRALLERFESLGDNCEFGLLQRRLGSERAGLLRHAEAPGVLRLADAIRRDFVDFGTPGDLWVNDFGGEWVATSKSTGFTFHTGVATHAMTPEQLQEAESTRLAFMARMLLEDLAAGDRIFVRRVGEGEPEAGLPDLLAAMREKGPARLLWVTGATEARPHGTVEARGDGLYRGYHGKLAPYASAPDFDIAAWLELLRAADAAMADPDAARAAAPAPAPEPEPEPEPAPEPAQDPGPPPPPERVDVPVPPADRASEAAPPRPASLVPREPAYMHVPERSREAPAPTPAPMPHPEIPVTESWRMLTGEAPAPDPEQVPEPVSEIPPDPDPPGLLSRLFGRKDQPRR